jgi:hypothetical protein
MVTDPIIRNLDQGRLHIGDGPRDSEIKRPSTAPPVSEKQPVDSFEKSSIPTDESDSTAVSDKAGGLKISYHFDLFYELSQKVSAKMGQKGLNRFTEVSATVAETFKGSFQLNIDAVGSYLKGTDKSLDISQETANEFMDSVDELSNLSPEALENFLREADEFFADLETSYGEAGGAFDDIRDQMKSQASQFFKSVNGIREEVLAEAETVVPLEGTTPQNPSLPAGADELTPFPGSLSALIPAADGSGMEFPAKDYKSFVNNFLRYVDQFRKNLVKDFLTPVLRPIALGKATEPSSGTFKEVSALGKPQLAPAPEAEKEPSLTPEPAAGDKSI